MIQVRLGLVGSAAALRAHQCVEGEAGEAGWGMGSEVWLGSAASAAAPVGSEGLWTGKRCRAHHGLNPGLAAAA